MRFLIRTPNRIVIKGGQLPQRKKEIEAKDIIIPIVSAILAVFLNQNRIVYLAGRKKIQEGSYEIQ